MRVSLIFALFSLVDEKGPALLGGVASGSDASSELYAGSGVNVHRPGLRAVAVQLGLCVHGPVSVCTGAFGGGNEWKRRRIETVAVQAVSRTDRSGGSREK